MGGYEVMKKFSSILQCSMHSVLKSVHWTQWSTVNSESIRLEGVIPIFEEIYLQRNDVIASY